MALHTPRRPSDETAAPDDEAWPEHRILVTLEHVTKSYSLGRERSNARSALPGRWGEARGRDTFLALDDVSLTVRAGEAFGIIGPNGAGKSTLLKVLAGSVTPTSGRVVRPARTVSIIELGLGFDLDLTGAENIEYGGALLGMSPEDIEAHREEIIDFAGLASFATMPVKRYSTGMLARLGFALATAIPADLFIVDEVLSVGDWEFQRRSLERIRQHHEAGAAIIFVSHNLWVVNQLCQRSVLLEAGRVTALGPTPKVLAAYLGDSPYRLEDGGVVEEAVPDRELGPAVTTDPAGDDAAADDGPGAAPAPDSAPEADLWRPVAITSMEFTPAELERGGSTTLRAHVEVRHPLHDHLLVAGMYWEGFATFAIPEAMPSEFLEQVGTHVVEVTYHSIYGSPGIATWQLAVVPAGERPEDPEQLLPDAIERATTTLTITGEVTPRPGIYFPFTARTSRLGDGPGAPSAPDQAPQPATEPGPPGR